ncbi:MAG: DNA polymerase I [Alphaproteobacteria bacterium]|jgi:DNA polymerase-1|nr:DNA polymerase I [Alphaproteobacteria bacterium]MDP6589858.1 DNA polymerase I [Alphaproteobacteria bacterium]
MSADEDSATSAGHLVLIDGSGFIFRAFHGLPPLTRPDGTPVNAVLGFTNMLWKLLRDSKAEYFAVIFDTSRKTFRSDIYPEYKAHRPPPPDELIPQFDLVRDATRAFNVPSLEMRGYEADDLIATYTRLAREAGMRVTIVSSDKDLMQLVEGDRVVMLDDFKNREIGPDGVLEKFGVGPDRVIDVQALAGDSSDNVPGVPGIGVKTAAQLINEYGDLDALLERAGEIKQPKRRQNLLDHAEMARISRRLVTLRRDVPDVEPLESLSRREVEPGALMAFLKEQGFEKTIQRIGGQLNFDNDATAPVPEAPAKSDYSLVQTSEALEAWIARAAEAGTVAFDTETTSLDAGRAELVGFSLSVRPFEACYVPLAHRAPDLLAGADNVQQIPLAEALALLKPMLENPAILKIGQNIKYDMRVMARHGINIAPIDDSMLLSYVLDGGLHGHGMDELSKLHLDHAPIPFKEVAGSGKNQITFDLVALEKARDYAAEDADITLRLHQLLKPRLVREHMVTLYERLERPLAPVLARMEDAGILVERAALARLSEDFAGRIAVLEDEIHGLAGHPFNIGSPKQLGEILFDEMSLAGGRKGKSGAYATGAEVLDGLAAEGHDLPARVLDWRQLSKLKSTYTDALLDHINPATGRVHTSYSMTGASTGRLSSNDPNLQNIPVRTEEGRNIRRAFVAEKGQLLLSADYSQIELRILAHIAGVEVLKQAFHDGLDIHALTASQVFGTPLEGMDPMVRRSAKAINFGIIYGISPFGLARQLGVAQAAAKAYIEAYFARYPGIKDYMERTKKEAREKGFVSTLYGRRCHLPEIHGKNPARRGFSERAAINAPIQGTAADIIKRAMIVMEAALAEAGLGARMLLQVHDELIFEVPEGEIEATAETARRVMQGAADLDVPLTVDTGSAANWAEAH